MIISVKATCLIYKTFLSVLWGRFQNEWGWVVPFGKKKWIHVLVCFVVTWGNLHRDMVHGSQVMYLIEEWPPTSPPQYWVILLLSCEVVDRDDLQNSELKKKKLFMIYDFFLVCSCSSHLNREVETVFSE